MTLKDLFNVTTIFTTIYVEDNNKIVSAIKGICQVDDDLADRIISLVKVYDGCLMVTLAPKGIRR